MLSFPSPVRVHTVGRIACAGFTPKLFERVDRAWKAVDKDGSGSVSTDELAGIMTELGQDLSDEQLREFIVSVDTNGDGTCDEHEFYNSMYQKMKTQQNKGCMAGFKLWKFENWRKFKTITTTFSILAGLVSIGIGAFRLRVRCAVLCVCAA